MVNNRNIFVEDIKEVIVLFRGSTSPQEILKVAVDVLLDWDANDNR